MEKNYSKFTKAELIEHIKCLENNLENYKTLYYYGVNLNTNIIKHFPIVQTWIDEIIEEDGNNLRLITDIMEDESNVNNPE